MTRSNPVLPLSHPEDGPRLLFFSGGTALNDIAGVLKFHTHNSVHLITPFDSGGSSQVLREAFDMPAVGDLRSRLVALADEQGASTRLMSYRLPKDADPEMLQREFLQLRDGTHRLMADMSADIRDQAIGMLTIFSERKPRDFDFRRASVGNLILTGGYFAHGKALEPVLLWLSRTLGVLGTVKPIADVNLQIGVELMNGRLVIGQARFTGKELTPISSPIRRMFLSDESSEVSPDLVPLPGTNAAEIEAADLICFPPGSLFSSVIANLLPRGVGRAIAEQKVPKIYVPSLGVDPECHGMCLSDQVGTLLAALRRDAGESCPSSDLISKVVGSPQVLTHEAVERVLFEHGIECLVLDVADKENGDRYDPELLSRALLSLCRS